PRQRSIRAFLNALDAAFTASALIGPLTIWSISSEGMLSRAASAAGFFFLRDIATPGSHAMPRTQNFGHSHKVRRSSNQRFTRRKTPSQIAFIQRRELL